MRETKCPFEEPEWAKDVDEAPMFVPNKRIPFADADEGPMAEISLADMEYQQLRRLLNQIYDDWEAAVSFCKIRGVRWGDPMSRTKWRKLYGEASKIKEGQK